MYYFYVLWSDSKSAFYKGYSSNLKQRIKQHNKGSVKSTSYGKPWKLIYYEAYVSETLAREREKIMKQRGNTWQRLRKKLLEK